MNPSLNRRGSSVVCTLLLGALVLPAASFALTGTRRRPDPCRTSSWTARNLYPESMSSSPDGTVYIGSMKGIVFRAKPGSDKATAWIKPTAANGILTLLGVLVDAPTHTLWLCSSPGALRSPPVTGTASLMAFDLKTGRQRGNYPFPAPASVCNDISVAPNGDVYASDTPNGRILRLAKGAKSLTVFAEDARLKGIDGLVFGGNGVLYLNNVSRNQLLIIDIHADGTAGPITRWCCRSRWPVPMGSGSSAAITSCWRKAMRAGSTWSRSAAYAPTSTCCAKDCSRLPRSRWWGIRCMRWRARSCTW